MAGDKAEDVAELDPGPRDIAARGKFEPAPVMAIGALLGAVAAGGEEEDEHDPGADEPGKDGEDGKGHRTLRFGGPRPRGWSASARFAGSRRAPRYQRRPSARPPRAPVPAQGRGAAGSGETSRGSSRIEGAAVLWR